jgi:prepilin-type N-terminal cleavage/methylation domain-containing protein
MDKINQKRLLQQSGFTLIELLVVIGIIAILAAIVLIAINPKRQFQKANDSQRISNVNAILNALGQNIVDNKGTTTCANIPTVNPVPSPLAATTGANISDTAGDVNLRPCLVSTYIADLPVDPIGGQAFDATKPVGSQYNTKYRIFIDNNGRYTVFAPNTELATPMIQVTR